MSCRAEGLSWLVPLPHNPSPPYSCSGFTRDARTQMARALFALILLLLVPSAAQAEQRIALLIGNQAYKPGVGALVNPLNDVHIVGEALRALGFEVLKPVHNANRTTILLAVQDLAAKLKTAGGDAVGFLYYSGHGIASEGENYLIPVDVEEPSTRLLRVAGVKHSEVLFILRNEAPNAAHYLVLDACRNALQGARGGKGFVPVGQQSGVLVAFAAEPGKTASDTGKGSGPYAAALAAELAKPGQNDLLMFHNVRVAVMDRTNGDQVPWTEDGIQRRQRVFFGGESKPTPVAPAQPQISEAERTWPWIKDTTNQTVLETFIKQFGGTPAGALARARIEELKAKQLAMGLQPVRCDGIETMVGNEKRCMKWLSVFKDCPECPEMAVIPPGDFIMGSNNFDAEKPTRQVTIGKAFAAGKFEVTFAEWDACVAASGCAYKPSDQGWGRGRQPVINVSWDDVTNEYLQWISRITGRSYRLLTEAEWEYAARAVPNASAVHTKYWWGDDERKGHASCQGCGTRWDEKQPAPIGSFKANAFGLHDMHGNVWEWVQDCLSSTYDYTHLPTDGSALLPAEGSCSRVLRGGSWRSFLFQIYSAHRIWLPQNSQNFHNGRDYTRDLGFRVARSLD